MVPVATVAMALEPVMLSAAKNLSLPKGQLLHRARNVLRVASYLLLIADLILRSRQHCSGCPAGFCKPPSRNCFRSGVCFVGSGVSDFRFGFSFPFPVIYRNRPGF